MPPNQESNPLPNSNQPPTNPQPPSQPTAQAVGPTPQPVFSTGGLPPAPAAPPKSKKKLAILIAIIVALLTIGGVVFAFLMNKSSAAATADQYVEALFVTSDYEAFKAVSDIPEMPTEEEFKETGTAFKEAGGEEPERTSLEESTKDGKTRAVALYKWESKVSEQGAVYITILLEKRDGAWKVVNMDIKQNDEQKSPADFDDDDFNSDTIGTSGSGGVEETRSNARDVERKSDINALMTSLEVFYNDFGYYPTREQINDEAFRAENLPVLDEEALNPPEDGSPELQTSPATNAYAYAPTVNDQPCTDTMQCDEFVLSVVLEDGSTYRKLSLNQ